MKRILIACILAVAVLCGTAYAATGGFDFTFKTDGILGIGNVTTCTSSKQSKADSESKAYVTVSSNGLASSEEIKVYIINASGTKVTDSRIISGSSSKVYPQYYNTPSYGSNIYYRLRGVAETINSTASLSGRWTPQAEIRAVSLMF